GRNHWSSGGQYWYPSRAGHPHLSPGHRCVTSGGAMHLARHLTDAELGAVLDAAGGGTRGDVARAHAAVCAVCRSAIVEAQEAEREVAAMLRHLDHPAPPLDVESIEVAAEPTIALRGVAGLDAASGRGTRTSTLRLVRVVPGDFED